MRYLKIIAVVILFCLCGAGIPHVVINYPEVTFWSLFSVLMLICGAIGCICCVIVLSNKD
jgi:hypothetical protein